MKRINLVIILVLFLISINLKGQQRIYFCSDYTSGAEPIGARSEWAITPAGANVKILYNNGKANITTSMLNLYIEKQVKDKNFNKYYATWVTPETDRNWATFDFKFNEPGLYRVKVMDEDNNELAKEFITIKMKENETLLTDANPISDTSRKLLHSDYNGASITFCDGIDSITGNELNPSVVFKYYKGLTNKHILVKNNETLNTNEFYVNIYEGNYYNNFVETLRILINPRKKWADFQYSFNHAGDYKFVITDQSNIYVATGYVKISK